jgi:hypothetical protein
VSGRTSSPSRSDASAPPRGQVANAGDARRPARPTCPAATLRRDQVASLAANSSPNPRGPVPRGPRSAPSAPSRHPRRAAGQRSIPRSVTSQSPSGSVLPPYHRKYPGETHTVDGDQSSLVSRPARASHGPDRGRERPAHAAPVGTSDWGRSMRPSRAATRASGSVALSASIRRRQRRGRDWRRDARELAGTIKAQPSARFFRWRHLPIVQPNGRGQQVEPGGGRVGGLYCPAATTDKSCSQTKIARTS